MMANASVDEQEEEEGEEEEEEEEKEKSGREQQGGSTDWPTFLSRLFSSDVCLRSYTEVLWSF